jgi:hypothetical protein
MNHTIETLWPINLMHSRADDFEDERLYLLDRLAELKDLGHSNTAGVNSNTTMNGYQPAYDLCMDYFDSPLMKNIVDKIIIPLSKTYWVKLAENNIEIPKDARMIHKSWLVEYEEGTYQNLHMHHTSLFTGVWTIYLESQTLGNGELHLHNPTTSSHTLGFYTAVKKIPPVLNDVYVIPAWLPHNVSPASGKRVVFVWDTMVVPGN